MKEQDTNSPIIHLQRQQLLLRMEYEYEKEEFKRQTENMGVARKVKRGVCWYPASPGRSYYNSLNQLVIEITHTENLDIEHNFEFGRPVCFFRQSADGKITYFNFTATVSYADEARMVVIMPGAGAIMDIQSADNLGVQLYFDETSYRTMFEALEDVLRAKGNRLAELRDILLGTVKTGFRELYPVRFPWLNSTQESAVNKVLCARDVAIVHGPPGTGKTTTLVEAIYETLHREPQVLVCAQSNMAVDWISEKLVDRGVNVLRIGNPTRVNDKMLSFTYERRFENHPLYPELWSIRKELRLLGGKSRRGSYDEREGIRNRMSRLRDRATTLEIQINSELFDSAHVIASTLVSSNHRLLNGRRFGTLFIDEAAQALEAACWIAIRKADRVVLAGDHCQLPPTIKCYEAARGGLEQTLMEKVVAGKPSAVSLLKVQYRMHEDIMLIGLVLWRRAGSCSRNTSPGNIGLGYSRYMARHFRHGFQGRICRRNLRAYQQRRSRLIAERAGSVHPTDRRKPDSRRTYRLRTHLTLQSTSAILAGKNKRQCFATSLPQSDNSQYRRRISGTGT